VFEKYILRFWQCKVTETFSLCSEILTGHLIKYRNYCIFICYVFIFNLESRGGELTSHFATYDANSFSLQARYRWQHVAAYSSGGAAP
jgi:hypothetical protein